MAFHGRQQLALGVADHQAVFVLAGHEFCQAKMSRGLLCIDGLPSGEVTEIVACGTGAAVTSIGELGYNSAKLKVGSGLAGVA